MLHRAHILLGLLTILTFLATGAYMKLNFPELYQHNESIRYQFRSTHIQILAAGLLNLIVGVYAPRAPSRVRLLGSVLLFTAPVLLTAAFFTEPPRALPARPLVSLGIRALALGTILHALSTLFTRRARTKPPATPLQPNDPDRQ